jgi:hypothetical protein
MAICIYSNGILEEFKPQNLVFTDQELVNIFAECKKLRTFRLREIANVWCLWGEMETNEDIEYNRLASEAIEEHIFSHLVLIHDTELDPAWNLTDKIIYNDYNKFVADAKRLLDEVADGILSEKPNDQDGNMNNDKIFLDSRGYSKDKKVLFSFDPSKQSENFYKNSTFYNFASQINDYLVKNKIRKPFTIYNDKKMVISVEDDKVNILIDKMLDVFGRREDYETCEKLANVKSQWTKVLERPKRTANKKKSGGSDTKA